MADKKEVKAQKSAEETNAKKEAKAASDKAVKKEANPEPKSEKPKVAEPKEKTEKAEKKEVKEKPKGKKEAKKEKTEKPSLERVYTVNLRDSYKAPRKKRRKKAISVLRNFIEKHMKGLSVKIDNTVNKLIWKKAKPPRKIKVKASKDKEGNVKVLKA